TTRWFRPVRACASPRTAVPLSIWAADQPNIESEKADLAGRLFCFGGGLFLIPLRPRLSRRRCAPAPVSATSPLGVLAHAKGKAVLGPSGWSLGGMPRSRLLFRRGANRVIFFGEILRSEFPIEQFAQH